MFKQWLYGYAHSAIINHGEQSDASNSTYD